MIWLSFSKWSSCSKRYLIRSRIYYKGKWTPFVKLRLRYKNKEDIPWK